MKKLSTEQLIKRLLAFIHDGLQGTTQFENVLNECKLRLKIS